MEIDHIAVTSTTLEAGAEAVEAALGVRLQPGGRHDLMGTHNRLLGLGDVYLEVIAVDPAATAPGRPRWFDMDSFAGRPRLTNWIARCDDLAAEVAAAPAGVGVPVAFTRGDLAWQMAVPIDGRLPFDGCYPALIQWAGAAHPVQRLEDRGCRLQRLEIAHPEAAALRAALAGRLTDPRVAIVAGATKAMRAEIATPHGLRVLE
ncbi:MAG: VOC family protein [Rhodobacteraceae bacterium]|nr:VOC family protein [Paracoccaceae bacterium]